MAAIDIGAPAIDRPTSGGGGSTIVSKDNPADGTGAITAIEVWANADCVAFEVATFFIVSGDNLSTRDSEAIGAVAAGSKQTFSGLDMSVETGDYIGFFEVGGNGLIELTLSAGEGYWYTASDQIPCTNQLFLFIGGRAFSVYGTGEEVAAGWTGKISGVTNPAKIMGIAVADITKVMGIS